MAALDASAVADYPSDRSRTYYPDKGNRDIVSRSLVLTLTGQGGQSNIIGAAALGFSKLISCSSLFDDTNNLVYGAVVDPVTNTINLDAGNAGTPTDVTATAYITVVGTPKVWS